MIREKAIFIKLNRLQLSDQQLYDAAVAGFDPSSCTCPACKASGRLRQITPYRRQLISALDGERTETEILVSRFLCESCGHTHALLPDSLIPFGSYSLRFVLTILKGYLERSCSVTAFCSHWQIAVSTLYGWIHLFISYHNAWCRILDRILWICQDALDAVSSRDAFPSGFFLRFGFSFLQDCVASPFFSVHLPDRRFRNSCT